MVQGSQLKRRCETLVDLGGRHKTNAKLSPSAADRHELKKSDLTPLRETKVRYVRRFVVIQTPQDHNIDFHRGKPGLQRRFDSSQRPFKIPAPRDGLVGFVMDAVETDRDAMQPGVSVNRCPPATAR